MEFEYVGSTYLPVTIIPQASILKPRARGGFGRVRRSGTVTNITLRNIKVVNLPLAVALEGLRPGVVRALRRIAPTAIEHAANVVAAPQRGALGRDPPRPVLAYGVGLRVEVVPQRDVELHVRDRAPHLVG